MVWRSPTAAFVRGCCTNPHQVNLLVCGSQQRDFPGRQMSRAVSSTAPRRPYTASVILAIVRRSSGRGFVQQPRVEGAAAGRVAGPVLRHDCDLAAGRRPVDQMAACGPKQPRCQPRRCCRTLLLSDSLGHELMTLRGDCSLGEAVVRARHPTLPFAPKAIARRTRGRLHPTLPHSRSIRHVASQSRMRSRFCSGLAAD